MKLAIIIHLAAQSSIWMANREQFHSMLTNVLRTMHFSMGLQTFGGVKAKIIVTAINVYKGVGKQTIHLEEDLLEEQNSCSFKSYVYHNLDSVK